MIENDRIIKVTNRYSGTVGYDIPDMGNLHRNYHPGETKNITFEEVYKLSCIPAGENILKRYLVIDDKEVVEEILHGVEPEYYYTREDVKRILTTGSLDELLDCLDFAPEFVLDMIKEESVALPLDSDRKRDAIYKKLHFNVAKAIEIANTKFDGDEGSNFKSDDVNEVKTRRVQDNAENKSAGGRRVAAPKYKVVETK